jgi:hypothetical protein
MKPLSKSKLLAYRQCPKRLWLELHALNFLDVDEKEEFAFEIGHQVGVLAREVFAAKKKTELIDLEEMSLDAAFERTAELVTKGTPIFEAAFRTPDALALADILIPSRQAGKRVWKMIEVKSSTKVKDYHRDDVAIQSYVARAAGLPLRSVQLAYLDNQWVYPGKGDYSGLFVTEDLTDEAFERNDEVKHWLADARKIARRRTAPRVAMGDQCNDPFECPFQHHCEQETVATEHSVFWLRPRRGSKLKAYLEKHDISDMQDVPEELLSDTQRRIRTQTLSGKPFLDKAGAKNALADHTLPAYFLDFETINFAIPVWKGTRPYQQIPFQYSLHRLSRIGTIFHKSFIDLSGEDPSLALAESLIEHCGQQGPIYGYNASFETARINELAQRFPKLSKALLSINARIVDLLPVAKAHYYHPSQQGSWSIKAVLPAACPGLRYEYLPGVQDGTMAMAAYFEAIDANTFEERQQEIEAELLEYCTLDTYALVRLWAFFSGSKLQV